MQSWNRHLLDKQRSIGSYSYSDSVRVNMLQCIRYKFERVSACWTHAFATVLSTRQYTSVLLIVSAYAVMLRYIVRIFLYIHAGC
jgi:hypothetical protein